MSFSKLTQWIQEPKIVIFFGSLAFGLLAGFAFFLSQGLLGAKLQVIVPLVLIAGPAFIFYTQAGWSADKLLLFFTLIAIPAFLDVDLLYDDSFYPWVGSNGFPIALTDVFFYPLLFKWLVMHSLTDARYRLKIHFGQGIGSLLLLLLLVNIVSVFIASYPIFSLSSIYLQLKCYLFYWFMINFMKDEDQIILVIRAFTIILFSQSVIAIEQNFIGTIFTSERLGVGENTSLLVQLGDKLLTRVSGTLGHPNNLAMFINLMLPILIFSLFIEKNRKWRVVVVITIVMSLLAELWTASRGGWLGLFISMFISCTVLAKRRGFNPFYFVTVGAMISMLALIVLFFASSTIQTRLTEDDFGSSEVRYPLMQVARNMIYANPVLGTGLNNYAVNMSKYDDTDMSIASVYNYPVHNTFLLTGGETGLIGMGLLVLLSLMLVYIGYQSVFYLSGIHMYVVLGATTGFITWVIHNQVNLTMIWHDFILWTIVSFIVMGRVRSNKRLTVIK